MKKRCLIFSLLLSTQLFLSGCNAISNIEDNLNTKPTQSEASDTNAETPKEDNAESNSDTEDEEDTSKDTTETKSSDGSLAKEPILEKTEGIPSDTDNTASAKTSESSTLTKKDVQTYTSMSKADLIKTFGDDYKAEGTTYTFSNGLVIDGLGGSDSTPTSIKCASNVTVMGIKNGMTFEKVYSILGKTEVIQTYIGTKDNIVYKIQYSYGEGVLKVISRYKDGADSYIQIVPQ